MYVENRRIISSSHLAHISFLFLGSSSSLLSPLIIILSLSHPLSHSTKRVILVWSSVSFRSVGTVSIRLPYPEKVEEKWWWWSTRKSSFLSLWYTSEPHSGPFQPTGGKFFVHQIFSVTFRMDYNLMITSYTNLYWEQGIFVSYKKFFCTFRLGN